MVAWKSSTYPLLDPRKESFALCDLAEHLATGLHAGTLHIPPVKPRAVSNIQVLHDAYDRDHLSQVTTPDGS